MRGKKKQTTIQIKAEGCCEALPWHGQGAGARNLRASCAAGSRRAAAGLRGARNGTRKAAGPPPPLRDGCGAPRLAAPGRRESGRGRSPGDRRAPRPRWQRRGPAEARLAPRGMDGYEAAILSLFSGLPFPSAGEPGLCGAPPRPRRSPRGGSRPRRPPQPRRPPRPQAPVATSALGARGLQAVQLICC